MPQCVSTIKRSNKCYAVTLNQCKLVHKTYMFKHVDEGVEVFLVMQLFV